MDQILRSKPVQKNTVKKNKKSGPLFDHCSLVPARFVQLMHNLTRGRETLPNLKNKNPPTIVNKFLRLEEVEKCNGLACNRPPQRAQSRQSEQTPANVDHGEPRSATVSLW